MKSLQILLFLLLFSSFGYSDANLSLPTIKDLKMSLNQNDCYSALCETSLNVRWSLKGKKSSQQLLTDDYPPISKVFTDEDGLIVVNLGNRYAPEDARYYQRFRYSEEQNIFYKAEAWETDSWSEYIAELNRLLKIGAFTKASQLVSTKGTTPNGGHSFEDEEIFSKFVNAIYREATRAKKLNNNRVAGELVQSLFKMPFQYSSYVAPDNMYVFGDINKGDKSRFNVLSVNKKNNLIVKNFSLFLKDAGYTNMSISLLAQLDKHFSKSAFSWKNLGDAYLQTGKKVEAIKAYTQYYKLMKEKGLEEVLSEEVLELINKKHTLAKKKIVNKDLLVTPSKNIASVLW